MRSMISPSLYIRMFGGLRAQPEGQDPILFTPQQTGVLLACLALPPHRLHSREELLELIWPETEPEEARHNLRQSLYSLRRQLEPSKQCILLTTRATVQLNPDLVATDVTGFEATLAEADRTDDASARLRLLSEAVELCQGELLPGFYQEAILTERRRLSEAYLRALIALSKAHEEQGNLQSALEYARRAVALDPLMEEAHRTAMQLYAASSQPSAAVRQYRELERVLREELDAEPSEETRQLLVHLRQNGRAETEAPRMEMETALPSSSPIHVGETIEATSHALDAQEEVALSLKPALSQRASLRPSLRLFTALLLLTVLAGVALWPSWRRRPSAPVAAVAVNLRNAPGSIVWQSRFLPKEGDKPDSGCEPTAVTTDEQSNIYVTGFVDTLAHDVDFLTLKYSPEGKLLWSARYNGPGNDVDRARFIKVDAKDCVYVVGESDNGKGNGATRLCGLDIAVVKYDPGGKPSATWPDAGFGVGVRRYNSPSDGEDRPVGIALGPSGNLYVAGSCWGRGGKAGKNGGSMVLLKYSANGTPSTLFTYDGGHGDDWPCGLAIDQEENIVLAGASRAEPPSGPEYDCMTFKITRDGEKKWEQRWGMQNQADDTPHNIGVDAGGNIYVVGTGRGAPDTLDAVHLGCITIKYDPNGRLCWARGTRHEQERITRIASVSITREGQIAVVGFAKNAQGIDTCRTVFQDENGIVQWAADYKGIQGEEGASENCHRNRKQRLCVWRSPSGQERYRLLHTGLRCQRPHHVGTCGRSGA